MLYKYTDPFTLSFIKQFFEDVKDGMPSKNNTVLTTGCNKLIIFKPAERHEVWELTVQSQQKRD